MNEALTAALNSGENLLWSGKAAEFKAFDGNRKKRLITKTVITLVLAVGICAAYLAYASKKGMEAKPVVVIILLLAGCFISFSVLLDVSKIRKLIYAVTDQRILVVGNNKISDIAYEKLGAHRFFTDSTGNICFVAGTDTAKFGELQMIRCAPLGIRAGDDGMCETLVLYAINEPTLFKEAISPFIK